MVFELFIIIVAEINGEARHGRPRTWTKFRIYGRTRTEKMCPAWRTLATTIKDIAILKSLKRIPFYLNVYSLHFKHLF